MAKPIDLDQLMEYPLRRGSEHCDEKNADPRFLNGVESILEWAQTLPTLTQPNEWVSVEERLPEKHSEYIVCACDEGEPIDERIWGDKVVVCADYYDGVFTWHESNTEYDISDIVTHWMPVPEAPDSRPLEGEV